MARMYEMNLIIRLQDRASARMRRIGGDMSALARHAQMQNKVQQISIQQERAYLKELKQRAELQNITTGVGAQRHRERMLSLQNREIQAARALKRESRDLLRLQQVYRSPKGSWMGRFAGGGTTFLSEKQAALASRYLSIQTAINAETMAIEGAQQKLNIAIGESVAEEGRLAAAAKAANAELARGNALAARYQSGRRMVHTGSLSFMGGVVGLGLLGLAAKSYADFDSAATRAATQFGNINNSAAQTAEQAKKLEAAILGMGKQYPFTAKEMANASYDIFSSMKLGTDKVSEFKQGLDLLSVAAQAAIGGQIGLSEATDVMITVLNNFDPELTHVDKNMAQLFSTVRFMRGGFGDLGDAMNKIAPAAKQTNQSLLQVGSAIAIVTRHMPSQSMSGTSIARLLEVFGRPDFINGMRRAGREFEIVNRKTGQLLPMYQIIGKLVKLSPQLQKGGVDLLNLIGYVTKFGAQAGQTGTQSTTFARRALALLITGYKEYGQVLRASARDAVEFDKSVKALSETPAVKWQIALNRMRIAWIQVGQAAMPTILKLTDVLSSMLEKWNNINPAIRNTIVTFTVWAAVAATAGGMLLSIAGGVRILSAALGLLDPAWIAKLGLISRYLSGIQMIGGALAVSVMIKTAFTGDPKATDFLTAALGGALLGARFGPWGAVIGAITVPVVLEVEAQFHKHKSLRDWAKKAKDVLLDPKQLQNAWKDAKSGKLGSAVWDLIIPAFSGDSKSKKNVDKAIKENLTYYTKQWVEAAKVATKNNKTKLDEIKKYIASEVEANTKLAKWEKSLEKEKVRAKQEALVQQKQDIKNYVSFVQQQEASIRATNEAAMGGLFGGPMSQGPIFGAYRQINDTLMGLGLKPIKIPVSFILQDQAAAASNFNDWQKSLATLSKKLGPKYRKMIVDLQAQGIGSYPLVKAMAENATPAQLAQWKTQWKQMHDISEKATNANMKTLLDLWASYPEKVRAAILNGVDASVALNAKDYESWVVGHIPETLANTFMERYNTAISNWKEQNPKPSPTTTGSMPTTPTSGPAGAAYGHYVGRPAYTKEEIARIYAFWRANSGLHSIGPERPTITKSITKHKSAQDVYRKASGGVIPGVGSGDTVPAMLTPGEVVLNKHQIRNLSKHLGTANHPHAVFNRAQHFATGGVVAAKNYMNMKGVSIVQDPKTGTISVVNGSGVRYRKFEHGQSGWNDLNSYVMAHPNMGGKSVGSTLSDLYHSVTPSGLYKQAKAAYGSVRHPLRRVQAGGIMMYPGGKSGKGMSARERIAAEEAFLDAKEAAEIARAAHPQEYRVVRSGKRAGRIESVTKKAKAAAPVTRNDPGDLLSSVGGDVEAAKAILAKKKADLAAKKNTLPKSSSSPINFFDKPGKLLDLNKVTDEELALLDQELELLRATKPVVETRAYQKGKPPKSEVARAKAQALDRTLRKSKLHSTNVSRFQKSFAVTAQELDSFLAEIKQLQALHDSVRIEAATAESAGYHNTAAQVLFGYYNKQHASLNKLSKSSKRMSLHTGHMRDIAIKEKHGKGFTVGGSTFGGSGRTGFAPGEKKPFANLDSTIRGTRKKMAEGRSLGGKAAAAARRAAQEWADNQRKMGITPHGMNLGGFGAASIKETQALAKKATKPYRDLKARGITYGRAAGQGPGKYWKSLFIAQEALGLSGDEGLIFQEGFDRGFYHTRELAHTLSQAKKYGLTYSPKLKEHLDDKIDRQVEAMGIWDARAYAQSDIAKLANMPDILTAANFGRAARGLGKRANDRENRHRGSVWSLGSPIRRYLDPFTQPGYISIDAQMYEIGFFRGLQRSLSNINKYPPVFPRLAKGGWVPGSGNNDSVHALLTPGEFVLSKEMISGLIKSARGGDGNNQPTTVINNTHNYNGVDEKSISLALKQQEFRLRHKGL